MWEKGTGPMPIIDTHPNCVCTRDLYRFELPNGSTISDITANSDIREIDPRGSAIRKRTIGTPESIPLPILLVQFKNNKLIQEERERRREEERLRREANRERQEIDPSPNS